MKRPFFLLMMFLLLQAISCNKNDDSVQQEMELQNGPPLSFNLIDVPDGATNVDLLPTLSWESAKNPEGSQVTYDLYLGEETNPTTIYKGDISKTSLQIEERLDVVTDYFWKIVATDTNGNISQSTIYRFTTRYYAFPNQPLNDSANFSARYGHTSIVFKEKIWIFGGREPGNEYKSDVWQSNDGIEWTEIVPSAEFRQGWGHSTIVFDNKLWVIEGGTGIFSSESQSEVWYSSDGIDWQAANLNAPFSARNGHASVTFDDKMWVIGGAGLGSYKNDVWYSSDGIDWTEASTMDSFSERRHHTATVFNNKIWLIGGENTNELFSDVWYSDNGFDWVEATSSAPFLGKSDHTTVVFDNKLWVIGGNSDDGVKNDVWYSSDGINWINATSTNSFSERIGHSSVVFEDKIWVLGGGLDPFTTFYNDVWAID